MDLLAGYGSGSDSEEVAGGEPSRDGAHQNSAGNAGDSRRGAPRAFAATLAPRDGSKKVVQFHLPRPAGASEPAEGAEDEEDEDHIDDEELAQLRRAKRQQRTARLPDAGSSGVNNSNTGGQGGLFARLPAPKGQVPSLPAKGVAEAHQQPPLDDGAGEPAAEEEQEDGAAQRAPGGRSNFFGIGPAAATTRAVEATAAGDDAEGAVQGPARAEGGAGGYAGDLPGYQESASYYSYYNDSHGLPTASQDQQQYEAAWQAYYAQQQQQQQQALLQELVPGGGRKGRSREEVRSQWSLCWHACWAGSTSAWESSLGCPCGNEG
eukprot:scaffold4100_cov372-Prasinococcus_capsulatus_cf.AAC.2